jgi:hypothetical protein
MKEAGWARALMLLAVMAAAACDGASPTPIVQVTPTPLPTPTPTPTPEATPTPSPSASPTPEACEDCEEAVTNTNPPVRLTLRLYTVEDGFGKFIANPRPTDPIPVGWYARIDVTAKDVDGNDTNGGRPPTFNWTNGFLVNVGGGHTHQRRLKVLGVGSSDFWVRQQGVESNRLTLHFGP